MDILQAKMDSLSKEITSLEPQKKRLESEKAMQEQESADHPAGTVLQAWTQAWTLHGRLLRPAMVVVAKAPAVAIASAQAAQNDAD